MKQCSSKSLELYKELLRRGYLPEFCRLVSEELNTDFTAKQMLGFLRYFEGLPMETIADEMLAILEGREIIVRKKKKEFCQRAVNELCRYGLEPEPDAPADHSDDAYWNWDMS